MGDTRHHNSRTSKHPSTSSDQHYSSSTLQLRPLDLHRPVPPDQHLPAPSDQHRPAPTSSTRPAPTSPAPTSTNRPAPTSSSGSDAGGSASAGAGRRGAVTSEEGRPVKVLVGAAAPPPRETASTPCGVWRNAHTRGMKPWAAAATKAAVQGDRHQHAASGSAILRPSPGTAPKGGSPAVKEGEHRAPQQAACSPGAVEGRAAC